MEDDVESLRQRVQYRRGWTTMADILEDDSVDDDA